MNHSNIEKWDQRFLELADLVSTWSKDPSTKIGAVITSGKYLVSVGYNGLPAGYDHEELTLNDRELKYETIIHGEINAIHSARRNLSGCTLYTVPFLPCSRCASQIIQVGISRVVSRVNQEPRWQESLELSKSNFRKCGVLVKEYEV